jgi:hypothetical protein
VLSGDVSANEISAKTFLVVIAACSKALDFNPKRQS